MMCRTQLGLVVALAAVWAGRGDLAAKTANQQRLNIPGKAWLPSSMANSEGEVVEFVTDNCAMCDAMDPAVRKLEWETGKKLVKLNVQEDEVAQRVWRKLDKNRCGGFPLFYSRTTKEKVCGLTTEDNLRSLFLGERTEFWCAPDEMEERKIKGETLQLKSGLFGRLGAAMSGMRGSKAADDEEDEWEYEYEYLDEEEED